MVRRGLSRWVAVAVLVAAPFVVLLVFTLPLVLDRARERTSMTAADSLTGAAGPACESHASCAVGALCTRGRCVPITSSTTECRRVLIRFAKGAAELSSSAEVEVERAARCLLAGRDPQLAIEPSADASRSTKANDDLTAARRSAVRRTLEQRGVPAARLDAMRPTWTEPAL